MNEFERAEQTLRRLLNKQRGDITEADLQSLCAGDVAERETLEFKKAFPTDTPQQRDEVCKDIVAMANSFGGTIIVGIEQGSGDVARRLNAVKRDESPERIIDRDLANRVSPSLQVRHSWVASGEQRKGYHLIFVPRSERAPHAIRPRESPNEKALVYPWRNGRNTDYLSEARVADLYRERQLRIETRQHRLDEIEASIESKFFTSSDCWLSFCIVPEVFGRHDLDTRTMRNLAAEWSNARPRFDLPSAMSEALPAEVRAGYRKTVLTTGYDALTRPPESIVVELHQDGSVGIIVRIAEQPQDLSFSALELVSGINRALARSVWFSAQIANAGGTAEVAAAVVLPNRNTAAITASWTSGQPKGRYVGGEVPRVRELIDLDAAAANEGALVRTAAYLAGCLLRWFEFPDAIYFDSEGAFRKYSVEPGYRASLVQRAEAIGLEVVDGQPVGIHGPSVSIDDFDGGGNL